MERNYLNYGLDSLHIGGNSEMVEMATFGFFPY